MGKKHLVVLMDEKIPPGNVLLHKTTPVCRAAPRECDQHVKETDSPPLLYSPQTPPGCCVQLWGPQLTKDMDLLEQVQRSAREVTEGWNTSPVKT